MPKKKKIAKKAPLKKKGTPKPARKKGEGPLAYYARYKKWMDARHPKPKKPVKPVAKPKKKLTEYQKRVKARKEAEKVVGLKRGIKKKKGK